MSSFENYISNNVSKSNCTRNNYIPAFPPKTHLLSVDQLDRRSLERLFYVTDMFQPLARRRAKCNIFNGAVLACLFYEASTRTRFSFSSAFSRMGGSVIAESDMLNTSSATKGESVCDTARVISGYADVVVVRHSEVGFANQYATGSLVPVINGGDGSGEHPTQAILDIYTIENEFFERNKRLDGSVIAITGDLRYGRSVHSLVKLLILYDQLTIRVFSAPDLALPTELCDQIKIRGHTLEVCGTLSQAIHEADVIYATRIQKERANCALHLGVEYKLTRELLDKHCKQDVLIMHPLPRDSRPEAIDIGNDLDSHMGFAAFRQADNGVPVRMAIFSEIFGVTDRVEFY